MGEWRAMQSTWKDSAATFFEKKASKGEWVLGHEGQDCNTVCEDRGGRCSAAEQSKITSDHLMSSTVKGLGLTCRRVIGHKSYAGAPFVGPRDDCYFLTPGKASTCSGNDF